MARIAKKSRQKKKKNQWKRHGAGVQRKKWWMRGTLCSQGTGRWQRKWRGCVHVCLGKHVRLRLCKWERLCVTVSLKRQGEKERQREMLSIFLKSLLLSLLQFQRGRWRHWKILFSLCAQWSPCLLTGSPLPFHPVPSPLPFLFLAQWSYLVLYPPWQKLFHPCLLSF